MYAIRYLVARRRRIHLVQRAAYVSVPLLLLIGFTAAESEDTELLIFLVLVPGVAAALIVLTMMAFRPRPRLVLLLRPFNHAGISTTLVRFVRKELGFVGIVVTLADATVPAPRGFHGLLREFFQLGGPLLAWLGPAKLDANSNSSLQALLRTLESSSHGARFWLLSWSHLLRVSASDSFWQKAVLELMALADLVVVDVSDIGAGSAWELRQVHRHDRVLFVAPQGYLGPARELVSTLFPKRMDRLFGYRADGTAVRRDTFLSLIDGWF